ncbi:hypothetical protein CYV19_00430 [Natronobacterium gregoryi SP2]|nr:hypothetical protein C490_16044 [Natronobacterium gregoryi SP2]PLK22177.1 hypothetical protein CYV19_00430 [Natronobacterium gregoryi SP2]
MDIRVENGRRVTEKWDDVFEAMAAEPRRQLIASLHDVPPDESVSLPESAVNPNVPVNSDQLRQELYHWHLPLLADQGFVDWDPDSLIASRGPNFDDVGTVFDVVHSTADQLPDSLVVGCQRLEREREKETGD